MKRLVKKATKRIAAWLALGVIFGSTFAPITSKAAQKDVYVPTVLADTYVYDTANMIDTETEKEMNYLLDELEKETTAEVVVISYEDSTLSLEDYANELFNELGIGKKDSNNGVLLLMQKEGNHVRLEIGDGLEGVLTDSISGRILDTYYVPYRDESTSKAAEETIKSICGTLYNYYEVTGENADLTRDYAVKSEEIPGWVIVLIVIILIICLILFCEEGYSSGGSWGSSGSSWSSGGSSFSSFGGGHSSGGGASR